MPPLTRIRSLRGLRTLSVLSSCASLLVVRLRINTSLLKTRFYSMSRYPSGDSLDLFFLFKIVLVVFCRLSYVNFRTSLSDTVKKTHWILTDSALDLINLEKWTFYCVIFLQLSLLVIFLDTSCSLAVVNGCFFLFI